MGPENQSTGMRKGASGRPRLVRLHQARFCYNGFMRKPTSKAVTSERCINVTFRLRYCTRPGQSLSIVGSHVLLGGGELQKGVPLQYMDREFWQVTVRFPVGAGRNSQFTYNYVLRDVDGSIVNDWGPDRIVNLGTFGVENVSIVDSWNFAGYFENAFYTEPFKAVLLKENHTAVAASTPATTTHIFRVKSPLLKKGQTVCMVGSSPALRQWNTASPLLLSRAAGEDYFTVRLDLSGESFPLEYKYGVFDVEAQKFVRYEDGENRRLREGDATSSQTVVNDGFVVLPANTWKGAGVAIPVFSLRSQKSFGAGEFSDLKRLVDWCRQTGLKLIQILPVNDTRATHTWLDSYPYAAISAFALHPLYLNLEQVAEGRNKRLLSKLEETRKRLNDLDVIDYESVMRVKMEFIKDIYPTQREKTFKSRDYHHFFDANKHWLVPYAVFCHLRDQYGTANYTQWPEHRSYNADEIAALAAEGSPVWSEIALNYFIQFHLHLQLKDAADYAHANGIIIKGDIAIGVSRYGADSWQSPELYHMDMQAGAPPDAFAVTGQNWSFPTYNWPRMKEDGYAWWKRRFEQMSCYFDAFRIDHILGFFRIWSIPADAVEGILGHFVPAIPVEPGEFERHGIRLDADRFAKPYITDQVLSDTFVVDAPVVRERYLNLGVTWKLKPEFATQRAVETCFAGLEQNEVNQRIKLGLYSLISNVILLQDGNGQYHFRFDMEKTSSFKALEPGVQASLKALYIDYFFRRQDEFWKEEALQKLPAMKHVTNMLICGEDLGLVPECVPDVMRDLGLLSLEIQRMPKAQNEEFFHPDEAPYLSVVTPSTHDMSTIRGWWEEDPKTIQKFYNIELEQPGWAPPTCESWISRLIVEQHLASPAMWSIFQLQDILGVNDALRREDVESERINVPAITPYYWRYRMHVTLESLIEDQTFNESIKHALKRNRRG